MIEDKDIRVGFEYLDLRSPYNPIEEVTKVTEKSVHLKLTDVHSLKVRYTKWDKKEWLKYVNRPMMHYYN